jgi:hypothetical protein
MWATESVWMFWKSEKFLALVRIETRIFATFAMIFILTELFGLQMKQRETQNDITHRPVCSLIRRVEGLGSCADTWHGVTVVRVWRKLEEILSEDVKVFFCFEKKLVIRNYTVCDCSGHY